MPKPDVLGNRCEYRSYYLDQVGGGVSTVFTGRPHQKGHGIGSMLKGLFRWAKPLLVRGAKYVGTKAATTGYKILGDVVEGQDIKTAAKRRFNETMDNIVNPQKGSGVIKRLKLKRLSVARRKSKNALRDIFSRQNALTSST